MSRRELTKVVRDRYWRASTKKAARVSIWRSAATPALLLVRKQGGCEARRANNLDQDLSQGTGVVVG